MSRHTRTEHAPTINLGSTQTADGTTLYRRTRESIVASALTLGAAMVAFTLLWRPWPKRNDFSYDSFVKVRDAAWAGAVVDHAGFTLVAIALPIAVCMLVRARGAKVANIGAVLTSIGGVLFATGFYSVIVLAWYTTAPDAIPPAEGTSLMDYVDANKAHFLGPQLVGFLAFNVGVILLAVALRRAAVTPRWLPIAIIALTIAQFLSPTAALDVVQSLHMAALAAVAWCLWRARAASAAGASAGTQDAAR